MNNPWDTLSSTFHTQKDDLEISEDAADNILIAWPVVLGFLKKQIRTPHGVKLLEFGCGTGAFAHKLETQGYLVTGIDSSEEMITIAKDLYPEMSFQVGSSSAASQRGPFDVITSIMTLQFIEDIENTLKNLSDSLKKGGIFVFAVHNPLYIAEMLRAKAKLFQDFDSIQNPEKGVIKLGETNIPIYIRTVQAYNKMLEALNFQPLLEEYPPFTEEFFAKYPNYTRSKHSEYLILGYRKE